MFFSSRSIISHMLHHCYGLSYAICILTTICFGNTNLLIPQFYPYVRPGKYHSWQGCFAKKAENHMLSSKSQYATRQIIKCKLIMHTIEWNRGNNCILPLGVLLFAPAIQYCCRQDYNYQMKCAFACRHWVQHCWSHLKAQAKQLPIHAHQLAIEVFWFWVSPSIDFGFYYTDRLLAEEPGSISKSVNVCFPVTKIKANVTPFKYTSQYSIS